MSYSRQPNCLLAGRALKQTPSEETTDPAGVIPVLLEVDIATTGQLGVIQVGAGLSITPAGVLSATGGGSSLINVKLVSVDYTTTLTDYYIGATGSGLTITLLTGVTGKVFVVKNQNASGTVKVQGSSGQLIDTATFKTLGSGASMIVVFDGTRWNLI